MVISDLLGEPKLWGICYPVVTGKACHTKHCGLRIHGTRTAMERRNNINTPDVATYVSSIDTMLCRAGICRILIIGKNHNNYAHLTLNTIQIVL